MSGAPPINFELYSTITKVATDTKAENRTFHMHLFKLFLTLQLITRHITSQCSGKKSFWQYNLKTFMPNGLNEREAPVNVGYSCFLVNMHTTYDHTFVVILVGMRKT